MTACVNNKKYGRRVAGVVTASLVGALTLGGVSLAAVPTVALAEDAAPQLSTSDLVNSKSVEYKLLDPETGNAVASNPKGFTGKVGSRDVLFEANGTSYKLAVDKFSLSNGKTYTVGGSADADPAAADFYFEVHKANDDKTAGELVANNEVAGPGKYVVVFKGLSGSGHEGETYTAYFVVSGQAFGTVTATKPDYTAAFSATFSGNDIAAGFTDTNGATSKKLVEGEDYSVTYTYASLKGGRPTTVDAIKGAGTYTAHIKGLGLYEGKNATVDNIKVDAFRVGNSLSNVSVTFPPYILDDGSAPEHPLTVSDLSGNSLDASLATLSVVSTPTTSGSGAVSYRVIFDETEVDNKNIDLDGYANSALTSIAMPGDVADYAATFKYAGTDLQDSYVLDASQGNFFVPENIQAVSGKAKLGSIATGDWTVVSGKVAAGATSVGNAKANFDAHVAGTYKVAVKYFAQKTVEDVDGVGGDDTLWYAGSKTVTVTYKAGSIDADSGMYVYFDADGKYGTPNNDIDDHAITSYSKAYDGKALTVDNFYVAGTTSDGEEFGDGLATSDVTKKLVDKDGKEVKSVKDAGEYKLVVSSDKYAVSGGVELPITIAKVDLTKATVGAVKQWNDVAGEEYLPLAGTDDEYAKLFDGLTVNKVSQYLTDTADHAITSLKLQWTTGAEAGKDDADHDLKGEDLIPSNVGVSVEYKDGEDWKQVGSINDVERTVTGSGATANTTYEASGFGEGEYRVVLNVSKDIASNFVLPEGQTTVTLPFSAYEKQAFSDVQPSDWFYKAVNAAKKAGYMSGYGNSTFGPTNPLTRAQAAAIFFNMSGQKFNETDAWYNKENGWKTGFEDVDGHQWYGQAIAWAKSTGVVNGYDATHFGPEDPVTREQFVSMLANYAKVVNRDTTVDSADASALDEFSDAGQVDSWARQNFAWAVSKKVAGNGGYLGADSVVTRAEAAGMSTNYQPNRK